MNWLRLAALVVSGAAGCLLCDRHWRRNHREIRARLTEAAQTPGTLANAWAGLLKRRWM